MARSAQLLLAAALAGLLLAAAWAAPAPVRTVFLMEPFLALYVQAEPEARPEAMTRTILDPYPVLYGRIIERPSAKALADYLQQQKPQLPALRLLAAAFRRQLPLTLAILRRELGPLKPMTIYVAPSLFSSNGQVRMVDGAPVVAFGPDVQAYVAANLVKQAPAGDLRALVAHETFHAQHYARNPAMALLANRLFIPEQKPPLYLNLWIEGLATCASMMMDGDGAVESALMSDELARALPPLVPKLAAELGEKSQSTADDDYRDYFWLSGRRRDIPKRAGYGIGALVADRVVTQMGLRRAILLSGEPLRLAVMEGLDQLKDGARPWSEVCQKAVRPRPGPAGH